MGAVCSALLAVFRKRPVIQRIYNVEDLRTVICKVVKELYRLTSSDKQDIIALLANDDKTICKNALEVIEEELTCRVCMSLVKQARSLRCGHIFCRNCIQRWRDSKGYCTGTCPICRVWFSILMPFPGLDEIFELVIDYSEVYKQEKLQEIREIARSAYRLHQLNFSDYVEYPVEEDIMIGQMRLIRETYNGKIIFHIDNLEEYLRLE